MQPVNLKSPILSVENLSVVRGNKTLLENVSFTADSGDLIWISGSNGIGKTSLLKCLAGLLRPAQGEINWNKQSPALAANTIAFHGHKDAHKPNLTVEENLDFWQSVYDANPNDSRLIEQLDLAYLKKRKARELSAGQSRRVALARLLLKQAPYWLLDEPEAPLDETGRAMVADLVSAHLANDGIAIIASHRPPSKLGSNARHMILNRGDHE